MSESKRDESFKVVDRRLFTPEGEFRKEVAEQQDRERETAPPANAASTAAAASSTGAAGAGDGRKTGDSECESGGNAFCYCPAGGCAEALSCV